MSLDYGIEPVGFLDTSIEEAKREEYIDRAASELRIEAPESVSAALFDDDRIVAAMQQVIVTGCSSELLKLIEDISRGLVIDGDV